MGIGLDLTGVARARQETNPDEFCRELCEWLPTITGEFFEGAHGPGCGHDHDHDDGECGHSHDAGAAEDDTCRMVLGTVQLFP